MALSDAAVGTLLLVMLTGPTLAGEGRFKLRELYPQERIEQVLVSRDRWRP